jgi:hypothetical protein
MAKTQLRARSRLLKSNTAIGPATAAHGPLGKAPGWHPNHMGCWSKIKCPRQNVSTGNESRHGHLGDGYAAIVRRGPSGVSGIETVKGSVL